MGAPKNYRLAVDRESVSYLLFLVLLLVLTFIAYWVVGIPALMKHLTVHSHWPEWWPILFYSIAFLLWVIFGLFLLCMLKHIELHMDKKITDMLDAQKSDDLTLAQEILTSHDPPVYTSSSERREWVEKERQGEKSQILRRGSDKTPSYDAVSQDQRELPTQNQQLGDIHDSASAASASTLPTNRRRRSKATMQLKRLSLSDTFPDTFENRLERRRSMSADFKDLSQMGSFDSYLHLVDIDTPMSPRNLFFRDLIKSAEEHDKRLAESSEGKQEKGIEMSSRVRESTSSTGEIYIAEVNKRPPSIVTEAYIEVEDNSTPYLWDHAEGQWTLLKEPVAESEASKTKLDKEDEIEDSVFK